ncbi:relaxase [Sphingomonas suaedae]|uniref:Relaxase n=1 Tax=Sphingomonas suaedae TaxID=2599297 RepID=A0A518RE64_9SPHN|nr:relaxase [Sphingomonas suaedae]QDX25738.1 relaxase [Sphingomonas suaedae]
MIIKASTRGNPPALARHLLNDRDNDQIEPHEVRGFMADDVMGAMREQQAIGQGVKSRQTLFSVSLSPPQDQSVDVSVFEKAIDDIELSVGLKDQPRVVIFHEKEGRRHAHAVWSRIDAESMTAIPLPFYKQKLMAISKDIYLEQGWKLPAGYIDKAQRDPRNFDLTLYQQAKREDVDAGRLKLMAKEAWALSDSREAFEQALEERGLYLARGERRSHIAMTWRGQVIALSRLLDRKTKEVRERLGNADALRSVEGARAYISQHIAPTLQRVIGEAEQQRAAQLGPVEAERLAMKVNHAAERQRLDTALAARQDEEQRERADRMRRGLAGLLDRITGRYNELRDENERAAWASLQRDRDQRQRLVAVQLAERQQLQQRILDIRNTHHDRVAELHRDLAQLLNDDKTAQRDERAQWLRDKERAQQDDRRRWLEEQQQIAQRHDVLPDERATTRHIATEPDKDRLSWLFEQQQRPDLNDTAQRERELSTNFNDRAEWLRRNMDRDTPQPDIDSGPDFF